MKEYDSAFPHESTGKYHFGLNKRDYIAIQAMQGFCSNPNFAIKEVFENVPKMAYKLADKMIKESNHVTEAKD